MPESPSRTTAKAASTSSRYVIGIDLGTTNCALTVWDRLDPDKSSELLSIQQWEDEGKVREAATLPSFVYLPTKSELKREQFRLPFHDLQSDASFVVGRLARELAFTRPERVIHSAKSWLCYGQVDRDGAILPWNSDEIVGRERLSPVQVSALLLRHMRLVFNDVYAKHEESYRAENQQVVVTVPASFDEVAQRLTLEAAYQAGYTRGLVRLLEEPQAAFYRYLDVHGSLAITNGEEKTVLICDVGGGTTDFSLFRVEQRSAADSPQIERIAVSQHILLGGDNIDLALAHAFERRLVGDEISKLPQSAWAQLLPQVRDIKERCFATTGEAEDEFFVSVATGGTSLFAGTRTASLKKGEIAALIVDGFFPECAKTDVPSVFGAGLREWGLPYAKDTAVTRHLAAFLEGQSVDAILYTGGSLKPRSLRDRISGLVADWQAHNPVILENDSMDYAVAQGASAYGKSLALGRGRIGGGYARSLYLDVGRVHEEGHKRKLLCVMPKGHDSTEPVRIANQGLKLRIGEPVRFQLFSARRRDQDRPGDLIDFSPGLFTPLPSLQTKLSDTEGTSRSANLVDVALEAELRETGVLDLYCAAEERKWQLHFNVRKGFSEKTLAPDGQAATGIRVETKALQKVERRLLAVYGKKKVHEELAENPKRLVRDIESDLQLPRDEWDTELLREMTPPLIEGVNRRGRSAGHETSWLYLTGYCLRPGFGHALDEWRLEEVWPAFTQGAQFPKDNQVGAQWWILWRRIAGGLSAERQEIVYDKIFPMLKKGEVPSPEVYLLCGSLERVDMKKKIQLGNQLVQQIVSGKRDYIEQKYWALARLASRIPLYGGPETIVRPSFVAGWAADLAKATHNPKLVAGYLQFLAQGARQIGERDLDLDDAQRAAVLAELDRHDATTEQKKVVLNLVPITIDDRSRLFGEKLPSGLVFDL